MSLDWNIGKVKEFEGLWVKDTDPHAKPDDKKLGAVTESLIWTTLGIDLGTITDANAEEFYLRTLIYHKVVGPPMHKLVDGNLVPIPFTLDDIKRHIGLKTNVGNGTRAKFLRNMAARLERAAQDTLIMEKRRAETPVEQEVSHE